MLDEQVQHSRERVTRERRRVSEKATLRSYLGENTVPPSQQLKCVYTPAPISATRPAGGGTPFYPYFKNSC